MKQSSALNNVNLKMIEHVAFDHFFLDLLQSGCCSAHGAILALAMIKSRSKEGWQKTMEIKASDESEGIFHTKAASW